MLDDESTPTPEETTTTPTQPEQSASTPDTSVTAADAVPPEKPAAKKAARKTQAKNAPGKKAATKKATAELPSAEGARDEAATAEAPTANKTAVKKTAPKKATAKKATAKKTTTTAKADTGATDESSISPAADSDAPPTGTPTGVSSATAMLFQPPEQRPSPAPKRTSTKPTADAPPSPDGDASGKDTQGGETGPAQSADEDGGDEGASRRRRRRGGRRRRKSDTTEEADREPQSGASADGPDESESTAAAAKAREKRADKAAASGKAGEDGAGGTRRRRRRRRQGEEDGAAPDDPENTVTRVREPRESSDDEISGVSGSTRLEAKKQRRREGREAGRRRAPIVSEAEFLARREAVDRVMVVRQRADLTQIGVLEDDVLVEHYVARESQTSLIGNVYLGRVQNVLPSMEAAFIDIGKGRNAVLYAGEVNWGLLGKDGEPRRIETALKSGQTILVQVTKDPVAHKGARLTSQVSLPGRYLVYVPGGQTGGISRKLPDTERNRLKSLLKEILPEDAGVIIRTAAEGASEQELRRDVTRLTARWDDIEKKVAAGQAPQLLYGEPDLMIKVVRDLFTEDFQKLVVSGDDAWDMIEGYVGHVAPDLMDRVERWQKDTDGDEDVFASYRLDEQIEKALERKVWLPSGGSLVIDRTEAMTVVDVNTGKFTG
ncbi:MAG: ribonuclease E/G, partial [Nocardioidaceae bacterium]